MDGSFKVVDLFAGPGGLAEGFSRFEVDGLRRFDIRLSVEKESSAFATLRLRSFVRQFGRDIPQSYYRYICGQIDRDTLVNDHPLEWALACAETRQLELGAEGTNLTIDPILDRIRDEAGNNAILVGGPPCQAYSLVGRARNSGISGYKPSEDHRHFLYKEYIRIIDKLRPAAFIMENVKGFLSSKVDGDRVFTQVLSDLKSAGGAPESYCIIPLVSARANDGREYILRAEKLGIPQRRHRVILFGIRSDLAPADLGKLKRLLPQVSGPTVCDVLKNMPALRSGLSKQLDGPEEWRSAVVDAFSKAIEASFNEEDELFDRVAERLSILRGILKEQQSIPPRAAGGLASIANNELSDWLIDPKLEFLANHESRGHMASDLARYAFAAAFAEETGLSPKATEFPVQLAPAHENWNTGKFADRFRVQCWGEPSTTVTSHIAKDGHYFIHPDPLQCRALSVREAARLQTFPDNYFFEGNRTQQYTQVGNAVPPLLAKQIAAIVYQALTLPPQDRVSSSEGLDTSSLAHQGELALTS